MTLEKRRLIETITTIVRGVSETQVTFIAASLAYYAFISLIPLLMLSIAVGTALGGNRFRSAIAAPVTDAVGPGAGALITSALTQSGHASATIVGLIVLLWSSLKLFRGLSVAFATVYDADSNPGLLSQVFDGLVTLVLVAVGIVLTVALGTAIATANYSITLFGIDFLGTAGGIVNLLGLTLVLLPLYYFLPATAITITEALPGAIWGALGWTLLQTVFRIYATHTSKYAAYGVLGGVLLLVTFLYFGALVLLIGVVINATLAGELSTGGLDDTETEAPM
ncbi:YihY/virulence factor BrkB family protein [Halocatena halophila]|uniref:YihY/virulence factor BrkB family protein n=1 Tax=Halocatena halophila TaxID=2814576 RepID=UPI002ED1B8C3